MKAQTEVPTIYRNRPWSILQAMIGAVATVFNREVKRNKLPGNVTVTASPDNERVQIVPIFHKAESRRAVQWANSTASRMKGKGFGL